MGLLDGIKNRVSSAVTSVKSTVTETVEKVEDKAAATGHAVASAFDSKPPVPTVPAAPAATSDGASVSSNSLRNGVTSSILDSVRGPPPTEAQKQAQAMIDNRKSLLTGVDKDGLANDMAALARKDPAAGAVLKEVVAKLGYAVDDDVSRAFVSKLSEDELRKMNFSPTGAAALESMSAALKSGVTTADDQLALNKLNKAKFDAASDANQDYNLAARVRGAETYAVNGNKSFNLSDPEQVKQLIANSPQHDNLALTTGDDTRCGGAALFNAMLLDGSHAKNAEAIETVLKNPELGLVRASPEQTAALQNMKSGTMTPNDAAQIQDLLYNIAKSSRPSDENHDARYDASNKGVTQFAVNQLATELKAAGAFSKAAKVDLVGADGHWTATVTAQNGVRTSANSLPDEKTGKATVGVPPPKPKKEFGHVTL